MKEAATATPAAPEAAATSQATPAEQPIIPIHRWTHDSDRVLIVKCVNANGEGYNGFKWPASGLVKPEYCKPWPDCSSGGLFGWPWGLNIGGGKEPDYQGKWIVFSAPADQVIDVEGEKVKVAAETPDQVDARVEFYGDWWGALEFTHAGRIAWIQHAARGSASATGYRGSASATGARGSASATGYRGSASATGDSGSASATGERGIASITRDYNTIEVSANALGAVTANVFRWRVRKGAMIAVKLKDSVQVLVADQLGLEDGLLVTIQEGVVLK